jgi:hypothetical protein
MNIPVTKKLEIRDGLHDGTIVDVEYRDSPYEYTDVVIEFPVEGHVVRLRSGYPTSISTTSKLGKLLMRFGAVLEVGKDVDPNSILVGKKCHFMTLTEDTKNGSFARVMNESVKPE